MGSLFRSEPMTLCQFFLQTEAAYNSMAELGELGMVQFGDLNPDVNAFQRKFVHEVRRCDEMERRLRFIEREIKVDGIPMLDVGHQPEAPAPREMIELENSFEKLETELKEVMTNSEALRKNETELLELKEVLQKAQLFFAEVEGDLSAGGALSNDESALIQPDNQMSPKLGGASQLSFIAGVIPRDRLMIFERMLWRVCRGNVFLRTQDIDKPLMNPAKPAETILKSVFIIYFQGEQLRARVRKICEGCRATLYPCPETAEDRRHMIMGIATRLEDLSTVMNQTLEHRRRCLQSSARNIKAWFIKVRKIKAIYHSLNMFSLDVSQKCLIGEGWCPVKDHDKIREALRKGTERSGSTIPAIFNQMQTKQTPPTFNRVNKFTRGYQNIVDAYGAATYSEVNPAPYTIITFPFLFAVMFGDFGHGFLMFLFALALVLKEKKIAAMNSKNEIFMTFFNGRYIILMMGLFSMYTGLLYNDCFSKGLNIFGSAWRATHDTSTAPGQPVMLLPQTEFRGSPYWFGIDPAWQISTNKILFSNSVKMKLSVLLGVGQMFFGTCLSFFNHTYFKKPLNIWLEFVPQIVFLLAIFGYMNILIVYKWFHYTWETGRCAPSILITLINMFLMKSTVTTGDCPPIYSFQAEMQKPLVFIALLCVPWMLVIKPFILRSKAKKAKLQAAMKPPRTISVPQDPVNGEASRVPNGANGKKLSGDHSSLQIEHDADGRAGASHFDDEGEEEEEFSFGDTFIEQAIHTIEYCLGSISHTASYLRLWALSLAHAELSEVLWTMVMKFGLTLAAGKFTGGIVMYAVFAFWAALTIGVLLLMEGLSAFLHALRLHWVEFQSKFYKGEGYLFEPYSFKVILAQASAEDD